MTGGSAFGGKYETPSVLSHLSYSHPLKDPLKVLEKDPQRFQTVVGRAGYDAHLTIQWYPPD